MQQITPERTVFAGRYRVGDRLGVGGMAEVFDGFDERLHRPVAIKVLSPLMAARPEVRDRFEAEARSAARLTHPNVVAVFDTGEDDDRPYIIMERLPGETLADRIGTEGALDPDWVGRVAGDVLQALAAAHGAGLVHRDVKPGNILIGADGCAKVADFGIAKSVEGTVHITGSGQVIGTPAYLAPERLEGEPASPSSDLYSLGVVLYEALTGVKPYEGGNAIAVAEAVRRGAPTPVRERRPDVPADLATAVERAMAPHPAARFATAAEMAAALQTTVGPTDSDATVLTATASPDPTIVLPVVEPEPEPPALPVEDRQPLLPVRRRRWVLAGLALLLLAGFLAFMAAGGPSKRAATADPQQSSLVRSIRDAAATFTRADGARWQDAAAGLRAVADAVEKGGGPAEADGLLASLRQWRASGELSGSAVDRAAAVLLAIPGTDASVLNPPTSTTVTTAAPTGGAPGKHHRKHGD